MRRAFGSPAARALAVALAVGCGAGRTLHAQTAPISPTEQALPEELRTADPAGKAYVPAKPKQSGAVSEQPPADEALHEQAPPAAGMPPGGMNVDPIKCWWRASATAVRVGEPFTAVLTCAALETDATTTIVDQTRLEPGALQAPPFEVTGGSHAPDVRVGDRRFFQYQYTIRVIAEDVFGRDLKLPPLPISYKIRSRLEENAAIQGRDQTYLMPAETIHVVSTVPADANNLRDAPVETFADLDARLFRASILRVVAGLLLLLGAVMAAYSLVELARQYRQKPESQEQVIPDADVLRSLARELSAIRERRQTEGWSAALVGRAMSALRIAGSRALSLPLSQIVADAAPNGEDGQLLVTGGRIRRRRALVSSSATGAIVGRELARLGLGAEQRPALEELQTALVRFTTARYGRAEEADAALLDESLEQAVALVERLKKEHGWIARSVRTITQSAAGWSRVWAR